MQRCTRFYAIGGIRHARQPQRKPGLLNGFADRRKPSSSLIHRQRRTQHLRIIEIGRVNLATGKHRSAAGKGHGLDTLDHQQ